MRKYLIIVIISFLPAIPLHANEYDTTVHVVILDYLLNNENLQMRHLTRSTRSQFLAAINGAMGRLGFNTDEQVNRMDKDLEFVVEIKEIEVGENSWWFGGNKYKIYYDFKLLDNGTQVVYESDECSNGIKGCARRLSGLILRQGRDIRSYLRDSNQ